MLALSALVRCRAGATAVVSVHALVSTAAHAMAQTDLAIGGSGAEWRRGCFAARSEPERRKGDTALGRGMRTTEVGDDSRAAWQHRNGAPVAHDARDLILSWRSSQCSRHAVHSRQTLQMSTSTMPATISAPLAAEKPRTPSTQPWAT